MTNQFDTLISHDDIDKLSKSEGLTFDDKRIEILMSMQSIDVQACPGSGKTTLIAAKLMLLAKNWSLPGQGICVLSHTNVAKDEIIERLKQSKIAQAQKLLSYPHFIGTIQEFVGKYIALPYIRSNGKKVRLLCSEHEQKPYYFIAVKKLELDALLNKKYLSKYDSKKSESKHVFKSRELRDESFATVHFSLDQKQIYYFKKPHNNEVPLNYGTNICTLGNILYKIKKYMTDDMNIYNYQDMYIQANKALTENLSVPKLIQKRFPFVFLDEMQDTQLFQDELLSLIFPLSHKNIVVQRFGDSDQAIFNGSQKEQSNTSYNDKNIENIDYVINKSHRFDSVLADKIKPLSLNQVQLSSEISKVELEKRAKICQQQDGFKHSIIIFSNDTINNVIETFGDIVSQQFVDNYKMSKKFIAKALGAVGKEIDLNDSDKEKILKIASYWPAYDKNKTKNKFNLKTLIEIVRYIQQSHQGDFSSNYKLLIDGIIKLLDLSTKYDANKSSFTAKTLQEHLQSQDKWKNFRQIIYKMLKSKNTITENNWDEFCKYLLCIFEINASLIKDKQYLNYSDNIQIDNNTKQTTSQNLTILPDNIVRYKDEFDIHLSTIHGVKGETHDATLIMETKNHCFDLETMLPYFIKILPSNEHPNKDLPDSPHHTRKFKPNKLFTRQLYVAASRPKHLLCLAIREDHINDKTIQSLKNLSWKIIFL